LQTLADFLFWAEASFSTNSLTFGHGTDNAWDDAVAIALHVLNLSPTVGKEILSRKLLKNEALTMIKLAERRVTERIPVPYLTHEAWFGGERYYVDERVIIPRSPFAELISNNFQPWLKNKEIKNVLDLCTGSACIAITCAKRYPELRVDAVDLSDDALAVAEQNIKQHNLVNRVSTIQSDLFQAISGRRYDIILSNPPYVSEKEHYCLPEEYKHEPKLAFISGADGFDCVRQILNSAADFLTDEGLLFVEVGCNWQALDKKYENISFTWLDFEHGGEGVFLLTKEQLAEIKMEF